MNGLTPTPTDDLRQLSLWHDTVAHNFARQPRERESVPGDIDADIAIVGAGYSGLWTAYYLKRNDPKLRLVVLDSRCAGFGASGRNGGWCSGFLPVTLTELAQSHTKQAAIEMYRQSFATVDEIHRVIQHEQIDCDFQKSGTINGATNAVQHARVTADVDESRTFGFADEDLRMLSPQETRERINVNGLLAASFTPHCAVINPAKLVFGLATTVERLGVKIYENSVVRAVRDHELVLDHCRVRADVVVRATEGYTAQLADNRRTLVPLYSYMVATEPLPAVVREEIRWAARETYHDARNLIIYAQITADGRIAFGGRGAPYHFASRVKPQYDRNPRIHDRVIAAMHEVFPVTRNIAVTHRWGGPLGVPRNWHPSVQFDRRRGLASLGGYVGDGVASANLAGRTLAHLIAGDDHPLTRLAWVNYPSPRWEIEPLRYIGVNGLLRMSARMDIHEQRTGTPDALRTKIRDFFL